jgi:linoleoyl-CoA desaturase
MVEETTNPSPNELGEMDNTWAIHQLLLLQLFRKTLCKLYTGGLNHQIEHHIFPKHQSRTLW